MEKAMTSTHLSSSILLWMRQDRPRQASMDYWSGPHSQIIAATPGFAEYRQIHLADENSGRWPAIAGVETLIPADRKIDGVAEVTFSSIVSPLRGRGQTRLAYKDEVNVFRRTLLYLGLPGWSRWHEIGSAPPGPLSRVLLYLRKREDVRGRAFRSLVNDQLAPALARLASIRELRTQTFLPWIQRLWNTPDVAHDNPPEHRFNASVLVGFANDTEKGNFFESALVKDVSATLAPLVSAVHAYDVARTLTYVRGGKRLTPYVES
jgi:hypothetical protein